MTRYVNFPLTSTIAGSGSGTVVSQGLNNILEIRDALLIFPANTSNLLQYRLFLDKVQTVPSTGLPGGLELNFDEVQPAPFVGESYAYEVFFNKAVSEPVVYVKFYATNGTASPLVASVVMGVIKE